MPGISLDGRDRITEVIEARRAETYRIGSRERGDAEAAGAHTMLQLELVRTPPTLQPSLRADCRLFHAVVLQEEIHAHEALDVRLDPCVPVLVLRIIKRVSMRSSAVNFMACSIACEEKADMLTSLC